MKIGVIVAMDKEFIQLKSLLDNCKEEVHGTKTFTLGELGKHTIMLQQCGIGKVNSAVGTTEMLAAYEPDLVISTGVAGGANPKLNTTEVVVSSSCRFHDVYCGTECEAGQVLGMPACFETSREWIDKALSLNAETKVHEGLIVTGDWFVDSRLKMQNILDCFPNAMAVDMESCSIAQVCYIYKVPFVSFRIISDVPLKDEKAAQYYDFWERLANGSFDITKRFLMSL